MTGHSLRGSMTPLCSSRRCMSRMAVFTGSFTCKARICHRLCLRSSAVGLAFGHRPPASPSVIGRLLHISMACMSMARMSMAHISMAHISMAHLDGTHVDGTHLDGTHLDGTHLDGTSRWHTSRWHTSRWHTSRSALPCAVTDGAADCAWLGIYEPLSIWLGRTGSHVCECYICMCVTCMHAHKQALTSQRRVRSTT